MGENIITFFRPFVTFLDTIPFITPVKDELGEWYIVDGALDDDLVWSVLSYDELEAVEAKHISEVIEQVNEREFILYGNTYRIEYLRNLADIFLSDEKKLLLRFLDKMGLPHEYVDVDRRIIDTNFDTLYKCMVNEELFLDDTKKVAVYRIK